MGRRRACARPPLALSRSTFGHDGQVAGVSELCDQWRRDLAAWAIPEEILQAVPDSPWALPHAVFERRADQSMAAPAGPSHDAAWSALDPPGSVLDVGAGAGAASLPLAARTTSFTAVDTDERFGQLFAERAAMLGLRARTVRGRWPDVAVDVDPADVVTCHHVLYNVPDIEPFVRALTSHARRRVIVEITPRHPHAALNPLWRRFHGLERPEAPTADDAIAVLSALGLRPQVVRSQRPALVGYDSVADLVDTTRRRLCLSEARRDELAAVMRAQMDAFAPTHRDVVTITWEPI